MKSLSCPHGCELRIVAGQPYRSIRRCCYNHLRRIHGASGGTLSDGLRAMLGDVYRESPEYELGELPVWPDVITVQPEAEP